MDAVAERAVPVRLAAVFLPAPLPREGRIAFWDPDAEPLPPEGPADERGPSFGESVERGPSSGERIERGPSTEPTELTVVRRHGSGVRRGTVPAVCLPIDEALPLLAGENVSAAFVVPTVAWIEFRWPTGWFSLDTSCQGYSWS